MELKPGVSITGIKSEMVFAITGPVNDVYKKHNIELVITSVVEGKHSHTSLHYAGCAVDLGIKNIPEHLVTKILNEIKKALGVDFDVVLEKDHFHVEWQPRYNDG